MQSLKNKHVDNNFSERKIVIDILRIVAILGVIFIHTTSHSLEQANMDILRLPFVTIENQLTRFAVPLFFLISGYILEYRYKDSMQTKSFYKKRATRLLIPYIFWSVIYFYGLDKNNIHHVNIFSFLQKLFEGNTASHLYFIPAIIVLYIAYPKIRQWLPEIMKSINFFLFTTITIILLIADYNFGALFFIPTSLRIALLNAYLFIIGMIITHKESVLLRYIKRKLWLFIILIVASAGEILYESNTLYLKTHNARYLTSQWRPSILLYTITLSSLIFYFLDKKQIPFSKLIQQLSRLTFFVFFCHVLFIHLFWKLFGAYLFSKSIGHISEQLWFDPVVFLFVTISSFLTAYTVSFIPKLNKITGIA